MLETILTETEKSLTTIAHRRGLDEMIGFSDRVRGIGSDEDGVVVAFPKGVDVSGFLNWIETSGSGSKPHCVCFDDVVQDPWPILNARRVIGLFESGRLITSGEADIVGRFILARPAGSYAFVLHRAEILETPEELETMSRIAWRMLVSPNSGPWRRQDLSRYGVYLWSSVTVSAVAENGVARDRAALQDWLSQKEIDLEQLRRIGALHLLELARQRLEASVAEPAIKPRTLNGETARRASAMLADLEKRLRGRWDADIRLLAREIASDTDRAKDQCLVSLDGTDSFRRLIDDGAGSTRARKRIADFVRSRMNQTNERMLVKVRERLGTVWSEMHSLVAGSDWSIINHWAFERGEKVRYPEGFGKTSLHGVIERELSTAPPGVVEPDPRTGLDAVMFFSPAVGAFVGGVTAWVPAWLMHLFFRISHRTVAVMAGAVAGALAGVWIASHARNTAAFQSSVRRCVNESFQRMRDATSEEVLKLLGSQGFEEWTGQISKLGARIAAGTESVDSPVFHDLDREDLQTIESIVERVTAETASRR